MRLFCPPVVGLQARTVRTGDLGYYKFILIEFGSEVGFYSAVEEGGRIAG